MNLQPNQPAGGTTPNSGSGSPRSYGRRRRRLRPVLVALEDRTLLTNFIVTKGVDDLTPGTLRYAVDSANFNPGADTIAFDPVVFSSPQTITLTAGELT